SKPGGIDPGAGELGGLTLAPGIYKSASGTFKITNGDLTLDAKGDANAVWIFQTAAGLTVGVAGPAGARSVKMINGALPKNVYWYVGSAATINAAGGGIMSGTIISSAGITFSTAGNAVQTVLNGRAISLVASVTMVNTTINVQ
ncbi:MAG: ice-binding family protein, partial [Ferruginibacter sp.]